MHKAEIDSKADKRWNHGKQGCQKRKFDCSRAPFPKPESLADTDNNGNANKDRDYVQPAPYKGRVATDKIAEDNIDLGAVHLADAGDHKSAMGHDFSTTHPARTMTRVSRTKMDHADNQEREQTRGGHDDP